MCGGIIINSNFCDKLLLLFFASVKRSNSHAEFASLQLNWTDETKQTTCDSDAVVTSLTSCARKLTSTLIASKPAAVCRRCSFARFNSFVRVSHSAPRRLISCTRCSAAADDDVFAAGAPFARVAGLEAEVDAEWFWLVREVTVAEERDLI